MSSDEIRAAARRASWDAFYSLPLDLGSARAA